MPLTLRLAMSVALMTRVTKRRPSLSEVLKGHCPSAQFEPYFGVSREYQSKCRLFFKKDSQKVEHALTVIGVQSHGLNMAYPCDCQSTAYALGAFGYGVFVA